MRKKSRRKPERKTPARFAERMAAPVDTSIFVDAIAEITQQVMRPYLVTPQEKRPGVHLTDTGDSFAINTDHPMIRLYDAARKFCQRRNVDDRYTEPIWVRAQALWAVVNDLKDSEQFQPYLEVDAAGKILGIRNGVVALAAGFPLRSDKMLFDPKLFLEEALGIDEEAET